MANLFSSSFGDGSGYVCDGDTIRAEVDGFTVTARIERDDDTTPPDERQDGFWPSLDPQSPGYIGPKSKSTLARELAHMREVMRAWEADEWWYVGVCVTVSKGGVQLTGRYSNALWGIDCNYPTRSGKRDNSYLTEVANELLGEAVEEARAKLAELCECMA